MSIIQPSGEAADLARPVRYSLTEIEDEYCREDPRRRKYCQMLLLRELHGHDFGRIGEGWGLTRGQVLRIVCRTKADLAERLLKEMVPTERLLAGLTNEQWLELESVLPANEIDRPLRPAINAMLYRLATDCAWKHLPKRFQPSEPVYQLYLKWRTNGTLPRIYGAFV